MTLPAQNNKLTLHFPSNQLLVTTVAMYKGLQSSNKDKDYCTMHSFTGK